MSGCVWQCVSIHLCSTTLAILEVDRGAVALQEGVTAIVRGKGVTAIVRGTTSGSRVGAEDGLEGEGGMEAATMEQSEVSLEVMGLPCLIHHHLAGRSNHRGGSYSSSQNRTSKQ